jgi:4-aminobutyrate aminotransferase-like enzyme
MTTKPDQRDLVREAKAKLAQALMTISSQEKPPRRFIAGADAVDTAEKVAATLQQQTDAYRELSSSLAYDDVKVA